jgi:hypothetical protein
VFVSHTSDLAGFPAGRTYVQAVRDAAVRAGMVAVDMHCRLPEPHHPGCVITRCHRFLRGRGVQSGTTPAGSAHPPAASTNTDDSDNPHPTRPRPLTPHAQIVMLTDAARWSLGRGKAPVP